VPYRIDEGEAKSEWISAYGSRIDKTGNRPVFLGPHPQKLP
jgi:hypothetical protein